MSARKPKVKKDTPNPFLSPPAGMPNYEALSWKHRLFVDNLILSMFNQTRAYLKTYPNSSYNNACSRSSELVRKTSVILAIEERLMTIDVLGLLTPNRLAEMGIRLYKNTTNDSVKDSVWKTFLKWKGELKDRQVIDIKITQEDQQLLTSYQPGSRLSPRTPALDN